MLLIAALIELAQITGNPNISKKAKIINRTVIGKFWRCRITYFFYTHKDQTDILVRKKEVYDGAHPPAMQQWLITFIVFLFSLIEANGGKEQKKW